MWTDDIIKSFYLDRNLVSDLDIMTELNGKKVLKNNGSNSGKCFKYKSHFELNINFEVHQPTFKYCELKFIW